MEIPSSQTKHKYKCFQLLTFIWLRANQRRICLLLIYISRLRFFHINVQDHSRVICIFIYPESVVWFPWIYSSNHGELFFPWVWASNLRHICSLKKGDSLSNSPFPFLDVLSICNIQYNLMSCCYKMNEYSIHFTATFLFICTNQNKFQLW